MELEELIKQARRTDGKFRTTDVITREIRAMYPGYPEKPVPELVYMFLNGMDSPKSCQAGHMHTFLSESKGYRPTCGIKGCEYNTSEGRTRNRSDINKRSIKKFQERTGLSSPSQLPGVGERISAGGRKIGKTRYEKIKATMRERYGVDSYLSAPGVQPMGAGVAWEQETRDKRIATNAVRYGAENPMCSEEVRDKCVRAYEENAGLAEIRDKMRSVDWWASFSDARGARQEISEHVTYSDGHLGKIIKANRPDLIGNVGPMEYVVEGILSDIGVAYVTGDRGIIAPKEIDILIPSFNVGVEVNGMYWHSEGSGRRGANYHVGKCDAAAKKGVRLIQFWDAEIAGRPDLVESILRSACGMSRKIGARKTTVIPLATDVERRFMDANHIQGYVASAYAYGLMLDGEIVAAMSFGKSRYDARYEWELLRYCNAIGVTVVGGAKRLFSRRPAGSIISYSDRRLFSGNMYGAIGMKNVGNTRPGYRYTSDYKTTESRVKYQKHKLPAILPVFDPSLTEWDNMRANGYDRLWDCGSTIWIME